MATGNRFTVTDEDNAKKLLVTPEDWLESLPSPETLGDEVWIEQRVDLETWLSDPMYMGLKIRLSAKQFEALAAMDEIDPKVNVWIEFVLEWGKGSGKDFIAALAALRQIYNLLCLRSPYEYYGLAKNTGIQFVNVAYTKDQAQFVYLKQVKGLIRGSRWFMKHDPDITRTRVKFPHEIELVSASSDGDSVEGQNIFFAVMDEASAFKTANNVKSMNKAEGQKAEHDADSIYNVLRTSSNSRFPGIGKVVIISYPRFIDDFTQTKRKENEKSARGWTSGPYATWDINPRVKKSDFEEDYLRNPEKARAMYECVAGHTMVVDRRGGLVPIREAADRIDKGERNTLRLTTKYGYSLEATADHRILMADGSWRELGTIQTGSKIAVSQSEQVFGAHAIDLRLAELMGTLVGDGWIGSPDRIKPEVAWVYDPKDIDVAYRHLQFLQDLGENPGFLRNANRAVYIRLRRRASYERFSALANGSARAWDKRVPDWVFTSTKPVVAAFLSGLFEADGSINNRGVASFGSTSEGLVRDVQLLLGLFGITAAIHEHRSRWNKPWGNQSKAFWTLQLSQRRTLAFVREIGFLSERKRTRCHRYNPAHGGQFNSDNALFSDIVISVDDAGQQPVYDLLDQPDRRFFANGLLAHNCDPPYAEDGYVKEPIKFIECAARGGAMGLVDPIDKNGGYALDFYGTPGRYYGIHVDLALNRDKCALALARQGEPVERLKCPCNTFNFRDNERCIGCGRPREQWNATVLPTCVVTLLKQFKPNEKGEVNFADVRDEIMWIRERGHYIWALSYDGWQSVDSRQIMSDVLGRKRVRKDRWGKEEREEEIVSLLSVDRNTEAHDTLKELILDGRFFIYPGEGDIKDDNNQSVIAQAFREWRALRLINGKKVDHPLGGSKDLVDALAGAAYHVTKMPIVRSRGPSFVGWAENARRG